jgi:ATP-dependent Clp protease ATP-binding subunit ClpA
MLNDVLKKIYAKYHLMVTLSPEVRTNVENYCCQNLFRGGISINQRLEEMLVSPLSKQLIEERFEPNEKVIISHISDSESGWEVTLSRV